LGIFSGLFGKRNEGKQGEVNTHVSSGGSGSLQVMAVFNIKGVGLIPVGRVLSGTISVGQTTTINGKVARIKSIEMHHQQLQVANIGDNVGICLEGIEKNDVQKDMVLDFR